MKKLLKAIFSLPEDNSRVFGLDVFRSMAILIVVYQHSRVFLADYFPNMPSFYFIDGVDVFFVLSGFLIGSILLRTFDDDSFGIRSVFVFWKRRWFRTLPNYYLVLFLIIIIYLTSSKPLTEFSFKYLLFLQNITSGPPNFFPESWSLAVEEWFYLMLPLSLFVLWKITHINKKIIFLFVAICFIAMSIGLRLYLIKSYNSITPEIWDQFFRKTVLMRFDMLMFGMLAAFAKKYFIRFWTRSSNILFFTGLLLMLITTVYFFDEYYIYLYITMMGISLMLLLPKADSMKHSIKWIRQPFYFISSVSYSMYLLNYTILLDYFKNNFENKTVSDGLLLYFSYWATLLLLSFILYKFFERPVMKLRDKV